MVSEGFIIKAQEHVISPAFFWPCDNLAAIPTKLPFWPNLMELVVVRSLVTPDGAWYFMGDPTAASDVELAGPNTSPAPCDDEKQSQLSHNFDDLNIASHAGFVVIGRCGTI